MKQNDSLATMLRAWLRRSWEIADLEGQTNPSITNVEAQGYQRGQLTVLLGRQYPLCPRLKPIVMNYLQPKALPDLISSAGAEVQL